MIKNAKVTIKKNIVSRKIEVFYNRKIIVVIDVFISGSVFVDKASRICINKNTHTSKIEDNPDRTFITVARSIED